MPLGHAGETEKGALAASTPTSGQPPVLDHEGHMGQTRLPLSRTRSVASTPKDQACDRRPLLD